MPHADWQMPRDSSRVPKARCWCFTATPTEGYPRGGEFVDRVLPRSGTRRCKEHKV
jgi:hypothetical protein